MKLTPFDKMALDLIRVNWINSISDEHEVVSAEYEQLFNIIELEEAWGELNGRVNRPIYQAIADGETTWAIVQLVQSKKGFSSWIKLMDIYMSPDIDSKPDSEFSTEKRLHVFVAALVGIFSLASASNKADTFKVYGRTDALIAFLRGMHDMLSTMTTIGTIKGINVSIEGRWLVFRSTKSI